MPYPPYSQPRYLFARKIQHKTQRDAQKGDALLEMA